MKLLAFIFAVIAVSRAEKEEAWCRCAAFVTYQYSEVMVFEAPEITIQSCKDDAGKCKNDCTNELNLLSNDGDLWSVQENGETVGQSICTYLAEHYFLWMMNHKVYGYYEVCGGAWQYADVESQQMLCCDDGQHQHCVSE